MTPDPRQPAAVAAATTTAATPPAATPPAAPALAVPALAVPALAVPTPAAAVAVPRAVVLLAFAGFVALGLPDGVIGPTWPGLRAELALDQAALGLLLGAAGTGFLAASILVGGAIARFGAGPVLAASAAAGGGGLALIAAAPGLPMALAGAAAIGSGAGAVDAGLNAFAATRFSVSQMNALHGFYSVGAMLGPFAVGALLAAGGGWRTAYAVAAALLLLMAAAYAATRRTWGERGREKASPATVGSAGATATAAPAGAGTAGGTGWRAALRHPLLPLHLALFLAYVGCEATLGQWCFTVLTEGRGLTPGPAGVWAGLFWGGIAAGRFGLTPLAERIGPRLDADGLIRLCCLGALAGAALFALAPAPLDRAGLVLAGLALAPMYPTLVARAPARLGEQLAPHAIGFFVAGGLLGAMGAPALAGALMERYGSEAAPLVALAAAVAVLALHERLLARSRYASPAAVSGNSGPA